MYIGGTVLKIMNDAMYSDRPRSRIVYYNTL